jgi:hypothetical protein
MTELAELQAWYLRQCDGDWEHQAGVKIDTLDNPGWCIKIDLAGTLLSTRPFSPIDIRTDEQHWLVCRREDDRWCGYCGPEMLGPALRTFLDWAHAPTAPSISA